MSAAADSKMVMSTSEFGLGLDLNLSLNSASPLSHDLYQEMSTFVTQPDQNPDVNVNLAPAISPDRKVVDLTKASGEFEDGGSLNSTLSTLTRKRNHPEEEPRPLPSREASPDDEDAENSRKKLRLSREQSLLLEETFKDHNTLNPRQKVALAKQLGLSARQVEVWFQNRRARTKLKQTEAECEFMKRNCESLMDRVRRLQKEVNELRAMKLAPQFYMQMPPAATLTLCPSCERVGMPTPVGGAVNAGRVGVECNLNRVGSGSGNNPWASVNQRPF